MALLEYSVREREIIDIKDNFWSCISNSFDCIDIRLLLVSPAVKENHPLYSLPVGGGHLFGLLTGWLSTLVKLGWYSQI